jgi:hypothetical protein
MNVSSPGSVGQAGIPNLSRVIFFDGQRLAAGDLNDAATVQRELRWLHNRSLHNLGIGLGFDVGGAKGDRQVTISPGYAIDSQGREIILTQTLIRAVPARADDGRGGPVVYYLVAAYPDDSQVAVLQERQGECGGDGAVRLQEQAAIYWKAKGEQAVEAGLEIVLAQATVLNCQLSAPLSLDPQRSARPPGQPYVAAGATPAGATPWELVSDTSGKTVLGVKTWVDTAAARFGSTPEYQARVDGRRFISATDTSDYILEGTAILSVPDARGFTLTVFLPRGLTVGNLEVNPASLYNPATNLLTAVKDAPWSVVWFGVEG